MTKSQVSLPGSLLAAGALAFAGCGGSSSGGGTGGKVDGGGTGGKGTGGMTGGTGGKVDGGGTGGTGVGGATDGGSGGKTDGGGDVPTDGTTTSDATDAATQTVLFDFENGAQGWTTSAAGATLAASTDQAVDGVQSLKLSLAPAPEGGTPPNGVTIQYDSAPNSNLPLWPGAVVTFHGFFPCRHAD